MPSDQALLPCTEQHSLALARHVSEILGRPHFVCSVVILPSVILIVWPAWPTRGVCTSWNETGLGEHQGGILRDATNGQSTYGSAFLSLSTMMHLVAGCAPLAYGPPWYHHEDPNAAEKKRLQLLRTTTKT